jgi:beta-lactamase class A
MSLPSGMLQAWPVGSPVTLHTLASLMISVSDNTATDTLLHLLGREKVEAVLGIAPVLSTRELFTLKSDEARRTRYLGADAAGKLAILSALDGLPLPDASKVTGPFVPGVEYDLSPAKLCALIGDVADLDVFTINPGVARPADWQAVAYKGGSEPGVLNMTTRVVARDGTTYCLSATWNAPSDVDAAKAQAAYGSVLAQLAKGRN